MKTRVEIINSTINPYFEAKVGDTGYIDAYTKSASGVVCAIVILDRTKTFELVELHCLKAIR